MQNGWYESRKNTGGSQEMVRSVTKILILTIQLSCLIPRIGTKFTLIVVIKIFVTDLPSQAHQLYFTTFFKPAILHSFLQLAQLESCHPAHSPARVKSPDIQFSHNQGTQYTVQLKSSQPVDIQLDLSNPEHISATFKSPSTQFSYIQTDSSPGY